MSVKKFVVLFFLTQVSGVQYPIVDTDVGQIKGKRATDGDYYMFLGIPFAQVYDDNPFGNSVPHPEFKKTYSAHDDSAMCPQIEEFNETAVGSFDCLRLNIFVPLSATSNNPLPVLVWLHGGDFKAGFGNRYVYGPKYLVRHDIILVTINYRTGLYGFLCLDIPDIPGNQGLKDQFLALKWIKNNIDAFDGDSNKITVFGENAGAVSIDMHLTSNDEKLFHQIILQSGTAMSPIINEPNKNAPFILAKYLGYRTNHLDDALEFLARMDPKVVVQAVSELAMENDFRPCIEKEFKGVENVLSQSWITADIPKVNKMPILLGFNSNERAAIHTSKDDKYYKNLNVVKKHLKNGFNIKSNEFIGMEEIVRHFYFGDDEYRAAAKQDIIDFESDFMYIYPTYRSIYKYLENEAGNIYLYVFSYVGKRNFARRKNNLTNVYGASHGDEKGYLFDVSYMKDDIIRTVDQEIIDQMTTLWTNFARYGDPTPKITELLPAKWMPIINKSEIPFMYIDSELGVGLRPFTGRATFWDLFYKVNDDLVIPYQNAPRTSD